MKGITDKDFAGFEERLKGICSDYQQYQKGLKELIRDVRGENISPSGYPRKQVVSDEDGEVGKKTEKKFYETFTNGIYRTLNFDRSISIKTKDAVVENIEEYHNIDFGSRNHNESVYIGMIETYCKIITDEKDRRENEAIIKNQRMELANRTIEGVFRSEELHITFQKNCSDALINGLPLENNIFNGYSPFDRFLSDAGISEHPDLKIYLHHKIRKNDEIIDLKVYAGNLKKEKGMYYLNNTIPLGGHISLIEKWLKACYAHLAGTPRYLRNDPDFPLLDNITELTQKDAERLAEIVKDHYRNGLPSERKSLELILETLGDGALDQLKNEKRLVVKSRNGRTYIIRDDGEVSESGRRCCVKVEGNLPRYDIVLAKYLAIRDRPETITTLLETRDNPDRRVYYIVLFDRIIQQYGKKIDQMGIQTGDFSIETDAMRSVWSIFIPLTEVTIKGGKDFTPIRAHDKENELTMELWDSIGASKLTPDFLHSAEYMNVAFGHYLAYLERYLAWSPEYVIMRNEKYSDQSEEKVRRIIERMEMRRTQERDRQCH